MHYVSKVIRKSITLDFLEDCGTFIVHKWKKVPLETMVCHWLPLKLNRNKYH